MGSVNGYSTEASLPQVEAVEFALRRVCLFLLTGAGLEAAVQSVMVVEKPFATNLPKLALDQREH